MSELPTQSRRHVLSLPELGAGEMPITASVWLVDVGEEVTEGDRLLEVCFGAASVDLPAPVSGLLVEALVAEDDVLTVGQALSVIETGE